MTDLNTAVAQGLATGLPGFGIVPRQDIDVLLSKEPDCFNLFLLALRELQAEKPGQPPQWTEKMSFYQLAGDSTPQGLADTTQQLIWMYRNSWAAKSTMGWRTGQRHCEQHQWLWVLQPLDSDVPNMAPAIPCHV
jgi:hypothetical protein